MKKISSNDIIGVFNYYGIEAAVQTIIKELNSIFAVYGIVVDRRHLALVADFMTFTGSYRPFNRVGMAENPSPLLRMSYETTMKFMTESALEN